MVLGPAGPSFPSSTGPGASYSMAYPLSSLVPQAPVSGTSINPSLLSTYSVGSSSNTSTPTPGSVGYNVRGHSSNTGAIAGGTVAGIAAISIIVVVLFFYRRRRRLLRTYVRSRATTPLPPVALVCSCVFSFFLAHRTQRTHQRSPRTMELRTRLSALLKHISTNTRHLYTVATPPSPEAQEYRR